VRGDGKRGETYEASSRNFLTLYIVIRDVGLDGMTIIGCIFSKPVVSNVSK
jgi:hypothetical protein